MKRKTLANFMIPFTGLLACSSAMAGDDPVNCHNETTTQAIYEGVATCYAGYLDNSGFYRTELLGAYFEASTQRYSTISSVIRGADGDTYFVSCSVSIPFSHNESVTTSVCDYTPQSNFSLTSITIGGSGVVGIHDYASDRDGNIVKTEWWVDGVYKGTTKPTVTTFVPKTFSIRQKVTDNDGYTDDSTRSIYVIPGEFEDCGTGGVPELCP